MSVPVNARVMLASRDEVGLDELTVVRPCARCFPSTWTLSDVEIRLVSPTGLVHEGRDYGETSCGLDATGPTWWWAL